MQSSKQIITSKKVPLRGPCSAFNSGSFHSSIGLITSSADEWPSESSTAGDVDGRGKIFERPKQNQQYSLFYLTISSFNQMCATKDNSKENYPQKVRSSQRKASTK